MFTKESFKKIILDELIDDVSFRQAFITICKEDIKEVLNGS